MSEQSIIFDKNNQWVIFTTKIHWEKLETEFGQDFDVSKFQNVTVRQLLGMSIIKHVQGLNIDKTIELIPHNANLLHFLDLSTDTDGKYTHPKNIKEIFTKWEEEIFSEKILPIISIDLSSFNRKTTSQKIFTGKFANYIKGLFSKDGLGLVAQFATAAGLILGAIGICQTSDAYEQNEVMRKKELTIELIKEIQEPNITGRLSAIYSVKDLLNKTDSFPKEGLYIQDAYGSKESPELLKRRLEEDVFLMVSIFGRIALLYKNGALDEGLFAEGLIDEFCEFQQVESIWNKIKQTTDTDPNFTIIRTINCTLHKTNN